MLKPVSFTAIDIAAGALKPFFNSWRYLVRKYTVPSEAIPKAMLKIKMVDGLKRMSKKPITPAVITKGIKHGNLDSKMIRIDLNKAIPTMAIKIISMIKLSYK